MIVLHSNFSKESRELVANLDPEHQVLVYPECLEQYPQVYFFPSVVINVPSYRNNVLNINVPGYVECYACYRIEDAIEYQTFVNRRAADNPPIYEEPIDEEKVAMAEAIIDLESRLSVLEERMV